MALSNEKLESARGVIARYAQQRLRLASGKPYTDEPALLPFNEKDGHRVRFQFGLQDTEACEGLRNSFRNVGLYTHIAIDVDHTFVDVSLNDPDLDESLRDLNRKKRANTEPIMHLHAVKFTRVVSDTNEKPKKAPRSHLSTKEQRTQIDAFLKKIEPVAAKDREFAEEVAAQYFDKHPCPKKLQDYVYAGIVAAAEKTPDKPAFKYN